MKVRPVPTQKERAFKEGVKIKLASDALKAARFGVWLEPKATKYGDLSQTANSYE